MNTKTLRKGQVLRRRGDGYVFVVKVASRKGGGAYLQCLDASLVYGWFTNEQLELSFERLSREEAFEHAEKALARWIAITNKGPSHYSHMEFLAADTTRRHAPKAVQPKVELESSHA